MGLCESWRKQEKEKAQKWGCESWKKAKGAYRPEEPLTLLIYLWGRGEGGVARGSPVAAPRRLQQIWHDPPQGRSGKATEALMAANVYGPTNDPFPGSVMGLGATISVVGSGSPTSQEKYAEGRRNARPLTKAPSS